MGNTDKSALTGWIKLHRRLLASPLFANERKLRIFIWCLLRANPHPTVVKIGNKTVHLERGQFITSRDEAAAELGGLSGSAVRRWLEQLSNEQRICLKANSKYTLVTVLNYSVYQGKSAVREQQSEQRVLLSANSKVNTEEEELKKMEEEKRKETPILERETGATVPPDGWNDGEWNE